MPDRACTALRVEATRAAVCNSLKRTWAGSVNCMSDGGFLCCSRRGCGDVENGAMLAGGGDGRGARVVTERVDDVSAWTCERGRDRLQVGVRTWRRRDLHSHATTG